MLALILRAVDIASKEIRQLLFLIYLANIPSVIFAFSVGWHFKIGVN